MVEDLRPLVEAELQRIEAFEKESGGLPGPVIIEGTAGGGAMVHPPSVVDTASAPADKNSSESYQRPSDRRGIEESFADGEEDFEYDEDEDEYDYASADHKKGPAKNSFWGWMEQYFVRLNQQHLQLLEESTVGGDPCFTIPPLGNAFRAEMQASVPDAEPRVGDVTARLLAALVADTDPSKKPKRRPDGEALRKSRAEEPSTMVFNRELAAQIDDKLLGTLMSNTLMTRPGLPPMEGREDDEICEMIRSLQHQLKNQIKINNAIKSEMRPLVMKRMEIQQKEEQAKKEWDQALRRYEALMASKPKKSKK